ncbi:squamosa promoter-binding protein 15 [Kitasatospora sp. NPDC101176]|uniref:squamosa promoter-binding protein 15 n=1 Tax=Kitasatospora sp. NPDC101176 TaxID=3364099 RepID=UPI003830DA43
MSHVANIMISVDPDDRRAVEELSQWLQTYAPRRGSGPDGAGWVGSLSATTGGNTHWGGGTYPECDVYAGALNHADLTGLVTRVESAAWEHPEVVQLFVMDQHQAYFRVWMFFGPEPADRARRPRGRGPVGRVPLLT